MAATYGVYRVLKSGALRYVKCSATSNEKLAREIAADLSAGIVIMPDGSTRNTKAAPHVVQEIAMAEAFNFLTTPGSVKARRSGGEGLRWWGLTLFTDGSVRCSTAGWMQRSASIVEAITYWTDRQEGSHDVGDIETSAALVAELKELS